MVRWYSRLPANIYGRAESWNRKGILTPTPSLISGNRATHGKSFFLRGRLLIGYLGSDPVDSLTGMPSWWLSAWKVASRDLYPRIFGKSRWWTDFGSSIHFRLDLMLNCLTSRIYLNRFFHAKSIPTYPFSSRTRMAETWRLNAHSTRIS